MEKIKESAKHAAVGIGELPPIPLVILESLRLLNDPASTVKRIQEQILQDQALTAFILKVANSVLYGLRKQVGTVSYAINLVGYQTTRSILTAYLLKNLYSTRGNRLVKTILWKHAISSAVFARQIAGRLGRRRGKLDEEEAFIAALLHDIGKGVLCKNKPHQYGEILQSVYDKHLNSLEAEREALGYTHVDVGSLLMKNWRFSDSIVETVTYHHNIEEYTGKNLLVPLISLANKLSHLHGYSFDKKEQEHKPEQEQAQEKEQEHEQELIEMQILGISPAELEKIRDQAGKEIKKYLEIF